MTKECIYEPDCTNNWWDDDDVEHDTDHASPEYGVCYCSVCKYAMIGGAHNGWFDEEDDGHGGLILTPRFNYCPNCGREVVGCE